MSVTILKTTHVHELNIIKIAILPKLIYRCNTIPIRIPAAFFAKIDKLILKFICKFKEPMLFQAETILKKSKVGVLIFPGFKLIMKLQCGIGLR